MGFRLLLLIAGIALFGCAGGKTRLQEGQYPGGKPRYRIEIDDQGRKHGRETWWHESGAKKFEAEHEHGRRHGVFQAWYSDAKLWYRGREDQGRTQDSLIYWHANGKLKTVAVFRDGIQLSRVDYDESGNPTRTSNEPLADALAAKPNEDSLKTSRLRQEGIAEWSRRVRATVESYWVLPKELVKGQYRSVAKIRVARDGKMLQVSWPQKSPSAMFNNLALSALKKVKKFPVFPETVPDPDLEIQYEFVTPGMAPKRRKLELKGSPPPSSDP
jgi:hypothetical protein